MASKKETNEITHAPHFRVLGVTFGMPGSRAPDARANQDRWYAGASEYFVHAARRELLEKVFISQQSGCGVDPCNSRLCVQRGGPSVGLGPAIEPLSYRLKDTAVYSTKK